MDQEGWIIQGVELLALTMGVFLGWLLPLVDHVIYCATYPHELSAVRFWNLIRGGKWGEGVRLLSQTSHERRRLVLHSILFQVVFFLFGLWVVTSSGNIVGSGVVLGAMLSFLKWDIERLKNGRTEIFWQIARVVEEREARVVILGLGLLFAYLSAMMF